MTVISGYVIEGVTFSDVILVTRDVMFLGNYVCLPPTFPNPEDVVYSFGTRGPPLQ